MTITEVMGVSPINSAQHFVEIIGKHIGWFHCVASTVPSVGKLFIIRRKHDKKCEHKVFVPNKNSNGTYNHAQSDFYIHTAYFMRCRYIQRALMDHPDYTMKDIVTIHSRWHLRNSPLYPIVLKRMIDTMAIDGLGKESLPHFLSRHITQSDVDEDTNKAGQAKKRGRIKAPSNKAKRYNNMDVKVDCNK